jgi:hypothetical protein
MTALLYPADFAGQRFQKLTLPLDGPDSGRWADEIVPPRLDEFDLKPYCWVYEDRALIHTVYHGGATTSGSKNPRSEWRETNLNGSLAAWDGRHGRHNLILPSVAINRLTPVKPEIVLGQIHDGSNDVATLRAEGIKDSAGRLTSRAKMYLAKGNDSEYRYLGTVSVRKTFNYGFYVKDGMLHFGFNGTSWHPSAAFNIPVPDDCYFKWGLYLQSNPETAPRESTRNYAQAAFYAPPRVVHAA